MSNPLPALPRAAGPTDIYLAHILAELQALRQEMQALLAPPAPPEEQGEKVEVREPAVKRPGRKAAGQ